ncbi:T9SS type A sorting domain-containing protein [Riemerella anatipestifer]|uniref:T9SS type A sorting domain-containing protein n=1 Tax=Riemerella anatipestifer TaxID=34085 RepID=UPI001AD76DFB|nr:T9SS type A sorting domain-containing protein [Riemerella anatipestifer]MBO4234716.1 T9SS type A sorting domain-containing protein [Riemerella anatipestifer]
MKSILLVLGLGCFSLSFGQEVYPAGVEQPLLWLKTKTTQDELLLEEVKTGKVWAKQSKQQAENINWNLSSPYSGFVQSGFDLTKQQAEAVSLFIVYHQKSNESEEFLWHLSEKQTPKITATNQRLADLGLKKYRAYPSSQAEAKVKIHYYQHYKPLEEEGQMYHWDLGKGVAGLPAEVFSGAIAEVIFYDRVLSLVEMQQVASYLAVKYGVSLNQLEYKNYYNSQGKVIWDYKEHKNFNQNITALGRDDKGNLLQPKSQNSNDEKLVAMALQPLESSEIPNDYFVFWSDNGGGLQFKKQAEGQPNGIERKWRLDYTATKEAKLHTQFSLQNLEKETQDESKEQSQPKYYWLVVDKEGQGNFTPEHSAYVKLGEVNHSPQVVFSQWEQYQKPSVVYTIWEAPEMFAHLGLALGKCGQPYSGGVEFNMVGGKAPYRIQLKAKEANAWQEQWTEQDATIRRKLHLSSGTYQYLVTDAQNRQYQQEFYLSDEGMPMPKLNEEYLLGEPLVLSPEKDLPKGDYRYEWYLDGALIATNPSLLVNKAGDYELRLQNAQGCRSASKFRVTSKQGDLETKVVLFPNPSTDGTFKVLASFPKQTSGRLEIYTMAGQLVSTDYFYNLSQYEYRGTILSSGVYLIQVKTSLGQTTHKLIVK